MCEYWLRLTEGQAIIGTREQLPLEMLSGSEWLTIIIIIMIVRLNLINRHDSMFSNRGLHDTVRYAVLRNYSFSNFNFNLIDLTMTSTQKIVKRTARDVYLLLLECSIVSGIKRRFNATIVGKNKMNRLIRCIAVCIRMLNQYLYTMLLQLLCYVEFHSLLLYASGVIGFTVQMR